MSGGLFPLAGDSGAAGLHLELGQRREGIDTEIRAKALKWKEWER